MHAGEHRKDEAEVSSTMAGAEGTTEELVQIARALTHTLVTFVSVNMVPSLSRLFLLPFSSEGGRRAAAQSYLH